jgi:integrase
MTPAGEAAFAARREPSSRTLSYERRHEAAFEAEQEAAFRANAPAWEWFAAHNLRHACATLLIDEGRAVSEVAEHFGHIPPSRPAMTTETRPM